MSTTFGNGADAQLMAEYEFQKPITATVIFFDSDDELDTPSEIKPNVGNLHNTENLTNNHLKDEHEATNETKHAPTVTEENTNIKVVKNDNQGLVDTIIEQQFQKNNTEVGFQYQTEPIASGDLSSNSNNITTTTLQDCIQKPPNTSIPPIHEDINTTVNECVQSLLNVVSNHMIFIMKAYVDYRTCTRTTSDTTVLEIARKRLQKTKYNFFYMSFSTVANILIPKENDQGFMQNFIHRTVKMAESKHLYFRYSDMSLLCEEMFSWVKSYNRHPFLKELLNKEPQPSGITTNSSQTRQLSSDNLNNSLDNTHCIFKSGPTGRELTINVTSTDVQKRFNIQNMSIEQDARPTSNELPINENSTNGNNPYSLQNAPRQSFTLPTDELRTNANATNYFGFGHHTTPSVPPPSYSSCHPVPSTTLKKVVQPASKPLRTNETLTNNVSHHQVLNTPSTRMEPHPIDEWRTNTNTTNFTNTTSIAQNMTLTQDPLPYSNELRMNGNYTRNEAVHYLPSRQGVIPHLDELRTNANSSNHMYQHPVQNSPSSHTMLTPHKVIRNKEAHAKNYRNYMQQFETFNTSNRNRPISSYKNKSTRHQFNNLRAQQQETYHQPTYSPPTLQPPPYDTVTAQNYVQNQIANSSNCENLQAVQESADVNRSLSRDSGFMSPLIWTPQDPMSYSPRLDQVDPSSVTVTPLITHVTSLNPSVAYIKNGSCHVCGKSTKDKCLGCFKFYYCSHHCQIEDWKNHVFICK